MKAGCLWAIAVAGLVGGCEREAVWRAALPSGTDAATSREAPRGRSSAREPSAIARPEDTGHHQHLIRRLGGPPPGPSASTAPVLPRSAQDDRDEWTALALG